MDASGIGQGIAKMLTVIAVLVAIVVFALTAGGAWLLSTDNIESEHRLEPEIRLIINNNQVDTLYIYKKP